MIPQQRASCETHSNQVTGQSRDHNSDLQCDEFAFDRDAMMGQIHKLQGLVSGKILGANLCTQVSEK